MLLWQKLSQVSDRSLTLLLGFVKAFLCLLADLLQYEALQTAALSLPLTLETIKGHFGLAPDDFVKFAACPKCNCLYNLSKVTSGELLKCTFVRWPHHTQVRRRQKCNTRLAHFGIAKKVYVYRSIKKYLTDFLKRPHFRELCNEWRYERGNIEYYSDIYDGNLWKQKHHVHLQNHFNLLGMLNVDFFQPYKHSPYSLGAIYMVVLNLPRRVRFKEDNVMLLGIIPGPTEPSLHMNTYITPLVEELKQLDIGVHLQDGSPLGNIYRFRLFGHTCDLPACRKLGGMVSFSATFGKLSKLPISNI